jgi:hypothetical protein
MSNILKSIVGLAIITSTIGLAAAPAKAESKAAQCKRFDQAVSSFNKQFSNFKRDPNQPYSANADRFLSNSESAIKRFQAQQFTDPKIRSFQQSTLNSFVQLHNGMVSRAEAGEKHDRQSYIAASQQIEQDVKQLGPLSRKVESYCGRSK